MTLADVGLAFHSGILSALAEAGNVSPIDVSLTRSDLAHMFAVSGFTSGAEIGVERGNFSKKLCAVNPGLTLLCVDAWTAYRGYREHVTQAKLDRFYEETKRRLAPFRAQIVKGFSVDVAAMVADGSLDFVYIDGNHTFDQVTADLAAWAPKVRAGGMVAGHDYGRASVGQVKEAVQAWTAAHGIETWYVLTGDKSPSWLWVQK